MIIEETLPTVNSIKVTQDEVFAVSPAGTSQASVEVFGRLLHALNQGSAAIQNENPSIRGRTMINGLRSAAVIGLSSLLALAMAFGKAEDRDLVLWDVAARNITTLEGVFPKLGAAKLIHVGEQHDDADHHRAQVDVIRFLADAGISLAVGLEMFQKADQELLDRWVSGSLKEEELQARFRTSWGGGWDLYREIFVLCRARKIPLVGLNIPRAITRQVAREGFASLTDEQAASLPPVTCRVGPEYEALMRRAHGNHAHPVSDQDFTRFCEAQLLWDAAMAYHALEYLAEHRERTMVVLSGWAHAWKPGIPRQISGLKRGTPQVVLLPEIEDRMERSETTADECDYLYGY